MQRLLTLGVFVFLASLASAQNPTGPFIGTKSEGFETQVTPNPFPPCVEDRVFNDQADLCANSAHITGSWGFGCTIFPHSGTRLFGSTGSEATYTFDGTVSRFGGFFGTNNPSVSDGTIAFFDAAGNQIGTTQIITAPNNCTWTWNGWDLAGAGLPDAKSIVVTSNYSSGGFMMMDDMEADFGAPGGPGTPLCFGDGSGAPCGCGNEAPSGSGSGCLNSHGAGGVLSASGSASTSNANLTLESSGILSTGLFFQGVNTIGGGVGVTFGDGIRCCGGTVARVSIENGGAGPSTVTTTITTNSLTAGGTGLPLTTGISAGDKRCYQYWYRDPAAGNPCGAQLFNLSNAVTVTWGP